MDVRCNRCATEYDFDDALISERGTTVRCTNCGYQFKVFPPTANAGTPERWVVHSADGRELAFTSLRDLQRAIAEGTVGARDLLSRGEQPARPLASIAELEPFFATVVRPAERKRTLQGVAPPGSGSESPASEFPMPASESLIGSMPPRRATVPFGTPLSPTAESIVPTLRAHQEGAQPQTPSPSAPVAPIAPVAPVGPMTPIALPVAPVQAGYPSGTGPALSTTLTSMNAFTPAPRGSQPDLAPNSGYGSGDSRSGPRSASSPFSARRRELRSYDELPVDAVPDAGRRARSRWIAAVVIAGVLTLFAATVGRRYLLEARGSGTSAQTESNSRVATLLRAGNRFLEEGQFEDASEQLLKASALAEKDPGVLAALARLETLRADVSWLKLRLLDPKSSALLQNTQRELGRRVGKARAAVDAAFAVSPENLIVQRSRVDALRIAGDADAAREWIKPIATQPSDPENAYALAALDLAETAPSWPTIIDRLKTASAGERVPGRAHTALIYALTRAGRLVEAEAQLTKLETAANTAPLLEDLRSFVRRNEAAGDAGTTARRVPAAHPSKPGALDPSAAIGEPRAGGGDFRRLLGLAAQALERGDLARAESLYEQVLALRPGNTEALAGLGDVAQRRNDPARAAGLYDRALADNPSYVPALLASADAKWNSGDRKGAVALYRRVVEQAGTATDYGRRAAARIALVEVEAEAETPSPPASADEPSATPPAPPSAEPPVIDTTDLPGAN